MATSTWATATTGLWGASANWTGGVPNSATADAIIDVAGSYTVSLDVGGFVVDSLLLNDAGATLLTAGTLTLSGVKHELDLTGGTIEITGMLSGGTVVAGGGVLGISSGVLNGVTWVGTLDLATNNVSLNVVNGLTVQAAGGALPGTIEIGNGQLTFNDSETLDNVVINIAGGGLVDNGFPATLTLGSQVVVNVGTNGQIGATSRTVVNNGLINVLGSGSAPSQISADLVNAGSINIGASARLLVGSGNFATPGSITMGAGSTLEMGAATSLAALQGGAITNNGGLLRLDSTLDLGAGTLDVAASGRFSNILLAGTLRGGTVVPDGGTLAIANGGVFDNITWRGLLDLASHAFSLNVVNGLTVQTAAGGLPGTIDIGSGQLTFNDSETLDNVLVNIVGGELVDNGFPATLTLGSQVTVDAAGNSSFGATSRSLVNQGLITVSGTLGGSAEFSADLTNAGSIAVSDGGKLFTISAVVNTGTMEAIRGLLNLSGLSGSGLVAADSGGTVELGSGPGANLTYKGDAATLQLDTPADFTGSLIGAFPTDQLILQGESVTAATIVSNTLSVDLAGGGSLAYPVSVVPSVGHVTFANGAGSATITFACFLQGTRLLTEAGEILVEALRVGDLLPTLLGGQLARVRWIGHRGLDYRCHPRSEDIMPICVRAGAFAPGVPARDLFLSPDHAVFTDEVLVPIRYLLNGNTIARVDAERVVYWHVELDHHEVILAEGLPAESYLDAGNRSVFASGYDTAVPHLFAVSR